MIRRGLQAFGALALVLAGTGPAVAHQQKFTISTISVNERTGNFSSALD